MSGFFKLSNELFRFRLTPKAFMVYAYLCCRSGGSKTVCPSCDEIAARCNLCRQTVLSALQELESLVLLVKRRRVGPTGYRSSSLQLTPLVTRKDWFPVPREIFSTEIRPTDFVVYCFLLMHMGARTHESFPSLTTITEGTGLSRRRVTQAVAWLRQFTFLNRVKRHYKRTRAWRHNRYLHFNCNIQEKKKVRFAQRTSPWHTLMRPKRNLANSITPVNGKCKLLSRRRW